MWVVKEHKQIAKICKQIPTAVLKKYELWKDIIFRGFHDEILKGDRKGQRSSRLSLQYRVIYVAEKNVLTVYVIEITPHKY